MTIQRAPASPAAAGRPHPADTRTAPAPAAPPQPPAARIPRPPDPRKFRDPEVTASGQRRARVAFRRLETLWFNTGTRCNITCAHCYIESSPANDRLAFLTPADVSAALREAEALGQRPHTVGFTGGEPFVNPHFPAILGETLTAGYATLVLTNAMRPLMRPHVQRAVLDLHRRHAPRLALRVSLDHWRPDLHDAERGPGSAAAALAGLRWLLAHGIPTTVAGRLRHGEPEAELRAGYAALFAREGLPLDARDPGALVLFAEMDAGADVPEITEACWDILGRRPDDVMCATSRMVVRRREAASATVVACTLIAYDPRFDLGPSLAGALRPVALNHPFCAQFCVLGGSRCTG